MAYSIIGIIIERSKLCVVSFDFFWQNIHYKKYEMNGEVGEKKIGSRSNSLVISARFIT